MAASQQDIQNSELLLDLSNQLNDSINERKKLLNGINAEEQQYFNTVKQQQRLSQDIAANAERYLSYQIKSKDLAKQIKANEDNRNKTSFAFNKIQSNITKQYQDAIKANSKLIEQIDKENKLNLKANIAVDSAKAKFQDLLKKRQKGENISLRELAIARRNLFNAQEEVKVSDKQLRNLEKEQQKQENIAKTAAEIIKNGNESLKAQEKELAFLRENERIRKRIEKSTGLLGGISKALSKIPGIGQYLNADEAIDEMEKLAASIEEGGGKSTSFGNRLKIGLKGASVLAKGLVENLKSPEAIFTFFISQALKANKQVVELGKSLGSSSEQYRENLADIARSSTNINVTTANLVEAFNDLVTATGFVSEFSADTLETQIMLTKQFGLTAEEAAGIYKFSVLTGKSSKEVNNQMVGAFAATRNSLRAGIPFKAAIAEASKISGVLASNLQNNPEQIVKAVVQAKALGTSLEQSSKQAEALLNFESSIENELKEELLTGKQLNLERARAAALVGDQVTLMEELVKNVGTIEEFDRMNVLQKKALAEAVGLTADELANQLRNQKIAQETGKSLAQVTEEQLKKEQERQSIQDKFNAAILKLQDLFGNLVAGPLGSFIDLLSGALGIVNKLGNALSFLATPLKVIASLYLGIKTTQLTLNALKAVEIGILIKQAATEQGKLSLQNMQYLLGKQSLGVKIAAYTVSLREIIAERTSNMLKAAGNLLGKKGLLSSIGSAIMDAVGAVFKGPTGFLGPFALPIALATGAAVGALGYKFLSGDDIMSEGGYGKRTLLAPEGAIRLNDKDTVIAGTNLGGGAGGSMPSIDLTPMISAINEVRAAVDRLYNKDTSINMDGKKVGTTLVQGSYKVA